MSAPISGSSPQKPLSQSFSQEDAQAAQSQESEALESEFLGEEIQLVQNQTTEDSEENTPVTQTETEADASQATTTTSKKKGATPSPLALAAEMNTSASSSAAAAGGDYTEQIGNKIVTFNGAGQEIGSSDFSGGSENTPKVNAVGGKSPS